MQEGGMAEARTSWPFFFCRSISRCDELTLSQIFKSCVTRETTAHPYTHCNLYLYRCEQSVALLEQYSDETRFSKP